MHIRDMQERAHNNSSTKGFWDTDRELVEERPLEESQHNLKLIISQRLALIHSEVSEALEAIRTPGELGNLGEELADVVIRVGDLAHFLGIDLETHVGAKMTANEARPRKHGKAF